MAQGQLWSPLGTGASALWGLGAAFVRRVALGQPLPGHSVSLPPPPPPVHGSPTLASSALPGPQHLCSQLHLSLSPPQGCLGVSFRVVAAPSASHTQAAATQVLCPGRDGRARDSQTEERTVSGEATALRSGIGRRGGWRDKRWERPGDDWGCRERPLNGGEMEMKAQTDMGDSVSCGLWANRRSHTLR